MSNSTAMPKPVPIASNLATWNIIVGALFGLLTLMALFAFAFLSAIYPQICSKFQFQLLAGGFALGAALAGGFIGGGAGAQGKAGGAGFDLFFGLTGGAALLIVTFALFSIFGPQGCDVQGVAQMKDDLTKKADELKSANDTLKQTTANLESTRAALVSMTQQKDAAASANDAARAEIKRLVVAIKAVLPDGDKLSASVSSITNMVAQSCSGGAHGVDPANAPQIRSVAQDAAKRIASAQTAIDNIVASVPADLRSTAGAPANGAK